MNDPEEAERHLWRAYRQTHYRVDDGDRGFTLRIGRFSPGLAALYARFDRRCAAFVTAWNPASVPPADHEDNPRRLQALIAEVQSRGLPWLPGEGRSAEGGWAEPSVLVLGLERTEALALGRAWGQKAIVQVGTDAIPRLLAC